jgi:hypothetical protein
MGYPGGVESPGREIPKEYREVVISLLRTEGWRYDASGKRHPVLYPPDPEKPAVRIPTTPSRSPRAFQNWLAEVRRSGGHWPPMRPIKQEEES